MKRFELLVAIPLISILAGCQFGQGESPSAEQAVKRYPAEQLRPQTVPRSNLPSPTAISGDPVAPQSRSSATVKPNGPASPMAPGGPSIGHSSPVSYMGPGSANRVNVIKADKEVSGYFKDPDGMYIGIEAVCRITEDSVICIKPNGGRDKNLEAKLDKIFQGDQHMYSPGISFKYKKKNRFILFKKEYPMQSGNPIAYASILQVGEDMGSINNSYLNVSSLSQPTSPQGPRVEYEMRAIAVPTSQKSVNVYLSSTLPEPIDGELKLTKGSKLTSGKFSIAYVSQSNSSDRMFGPNVKTWELTFRTSKPDARAQLSLSPIIKDATAGFTAVDNNGNVVKAGDYANSDMSRENRIRRPLQSVMVMPVNSSPTEMKIKTNVNPKYIGGLKVTALRYQIIKMKNIALD